MGDVLRYDFIDETLHKYEINKLRINILPKKGYSKSYAMLTTKYGSNDIKFSLNNGDVEEYPLGIAHFLEHKLFEEKEGNIFNKFALLGASPNAYTNFNVTAYYFTSTSNFYENLELLIKFVYSPYFTDESVEKEKGIIEQEIVMYEDNPNTKVYFNALTAMYKDHPVRNDIAGTVESIKKITPELLYKCYNAFYIPQNMILTVVGDVDPDKVREIAEKLVPLDRGAIEFERIRHSGEQGIEEVKKYKKMGLSIPNFIIGFKDINIPNNKADILRKKAIMDIALRLFFGRSSHLYEDLYNSGLINESFSYEYTIEEDYAHMMLGGESREPEKVKELILYYLGNNIDVKVSDFDRIKRMLAGAFVGRFNSIEASGIALSDYFIREMNLFDYYDILKGIRLEEVIKDASNVLSRGKCILSVVD